MMKRTLAIILTLVLICPAHLVRDAAALENTNYTLEPYNFIQYGTQIGDKAPGSFAASHVPGSPVGIITANDDASWVYAAIAVLNTSAKLGGDSSPAFSAADVASALSKSINNASGGFDRAVTGPGNRAMLTAYLMRGLYGGPVKGSNGEIGAGNQLSSLGKVKPMQPVSGIVYIPDLSITANASAKATYRDRIKNGVQNFGAVAASLYFDESIFYQDDDDSTQFFYHNTSRKAADHTVAIIGWDDSVSLSNTHNVSVVVDGKSEIVEETTTYTGGAFLVYDSRSGVNSLEGKAYWVSYDTILSGAYYIEGFYSSASAFPLVTDAAKKLSAEAKADPDNKANPLAQTYEYDAYGMTGARGFNSNSAYFANVFTVGSEAEALQSVSLGLTGEGNSYKVYYVYDYKDADSLKAALSSENKANNLVASGTRSLPGYYTVKLDENDTNPYNVSGKGAYLLPSKGKKFAIIVEVTCVNGTSPIPVQSTTLASTTSGRSYMSDTGDTWIDSYSQGQSTVCIKAHAEKYIEIDLTGISLPQKEDDDGVKEFKAYSTSCTDGLVGGKFPYLELAPGVSYTMGPVMNPVNATNVVKSETKWFAWDEDSGKWFPWNENWKDFRPTEDEEKPVEPSPSGDKEADEEPAPPVKLVFNTTTGVCTLVTSNEEYNHGKSIILKAETFTGTKDGTGAFTKTNGEYDLDDSYTAYVLATIEAVAIESIKLNKTEATIKAGSTATLTAAMTPSNASKITVQWCVAKSYTGNINTMAAGEYADGPYTSFSKTIDPCDLYNEDSPIATVSDAGKVSAIRDGTCYIYAKITQGNKTIYSPPCKVTVNKVDPTGVSLNKKKMAITTGTKLTLTAKVKPTAATNKRVQWSSNNPDVATVAVNGVITAVSPGTATITVMDNKKNKAECVITVTDAPTILRKGKTSTFSVLGALSSQRVDYLVSDNNGNGTSEDGSEIYTGTKSGALKYKLTANDVGSVTLSANVTVPSYNPDGSVNEDVRVTVGEQSWKIEFVVPISKLQMTDNEGNQVKKLTLCVDERNKARAQSFDLTAALVKPADATLLDFAWSSKKSEVASVTVKQGSPNKNTATITAVSAGSTKITALNYNGNKKATLTVKVLYYPTVITPKSNNLSIVIGKSASVKAKVEGKGVFKDLEYYLASDSSGSNILDDENDIVSLNVKRAKITARGEGKVYLIIRGAPYNDTAKKIVVPITVTEKKK